MKIIYFLIFNFLVLLLLNSCNNQHKKTEEGQTIPNKYATDFEIQETSDGYILKVKNRFDQTNSGTYTYYLSSKPESTPNSNVTIPIPVSKVACLSTSHIAFISTLDKTSSIKGISTPELVCNSEVSKLYAQGKIYNIGYDNQINYEKIISISPDVVFAFGVDNTSVSKFQKLTDLGIPVVFVNDFTEAKPLGRSEWIKFFACFYDKLNFATEYFDSIENNYLNIKSSIPQNVKKPKVLVSLPWKGTWWVPGGNSFFANFINDAGGEYIFSNNNHSDSQGLNIEEVFAKAKNISFWLNPNNVNTKTEILSIDNRLEFFEPYKTAKIYNNNLKENQAGGNDFWESGILHPDIILLDLKTIFHQDSTNNHSLYYYKQIN
ncbi:MAG TPA: ABC transporter substrate-binding protein [Bacteroidales bacterium]|nr:ABC transporter substrate-binding protein [Bacteroidales bacterium]